MFELGIATQSKDGQETLKKDPVLQSEHRRKQSASSGWGTYINRPTEKGQSVLQKQKEREAVLSKGIWWQ